MSLLKSFLLTVGLFAGVAAVLAALVAIIVFTHPAVLVGVILAIAFSGIWWIVHQEL